MANVALFLASDDRRCGNRRGGALEGSIEEPLAVLAELKNRGLIRHLGVSNVTPNQLIEAQKIRNIICVQNFYNVANRNDDEFIDQLAKQGIRYVPFFPLGGLRRYNRRYSARQQRFSRPRPCRLRWRTRHSERSDIHALGSAVSTARLHTRRVEGAFRTWPSHGRPAPRERAKCWSNAAKYL